MSTHFFFQRLRLPQVWTSKKSIRETIRALYPFVRQRRAILLARCLLFVSARQRGLVHFTVRSHRSRPGNTQAADPRRLAVHWLPEAACLLAQSVRR